MNPLLLFFFSFSYSCSLGTFSFYPVLLMSHYRITLWVYRNTILEYRNTILEYQINIFIHYIISRFIRIISSIELIFLFNFIIQPHFKIYTLFKIVFPLTIDSYSVLSFFIQLSCFSIYYYFNQLRY